MATYDHCSMTLWRKFAAFARYTGDSFGFRAQSSSYASNSFTIIDVELK